MASLALFMIDFKQSFSVNFSYIYIFYITLNVLIERSEVYG